MSLLLKQTTKKNDTKAVYEITKRLAGNRNPSDRPIKSKDGILLTNVDEQIKRWRIHFMENMSNGPLHALQPTSDQPVSETTASSMLDTNPPTLEEIETAIKKLKNNKSPGTTVFLLRY